MKILFQTEEKNNYWTYPEVPLGTTEPVIHNFVKVNQEMENTRFINAFGQKTDKTEPYKVFADQQHINLWKMKI